MQLPMNASRQQMMNVLEQWMIIYPDRALTGPRDGKADKEKENSIAKKSSLSLLTFHPLTPQIGK